MSSRFLVLILNHPNLPKTIHISIYLPTSGLDNDYVEELSKLEATVLDLLDEHPDATVYIRGDANASLAPRPGNKRDILFNCFCERLSLTPTDINHNTYHHFVGNISSSIDVILQLSPSKEIPQEKLVNVLCSKTSPNVDSKHDLIVSSFSLPFNPSVEPPETSKAPEVDNLKHKIIWSDAGISSYREILTPRLKSLQENWLDSKSPATFSVMLNCTNLALTSAAKATNKSVDLSKEFKPKKTPIPSEVSAATNEKLAAHKKLKETSANSSSSELQRFQALEDFKISRRKQRRLWRRHQAHLASSASEKVHQILCNDPRTPHKALKAIKQTSTSKISEIKVGDKIFSGDDVADGFYQNMKSLKTMKIETKSCESCENFRFDYSLIKEISKAGDCIPKLSLEQAETLLHSIKAHVCDHFNVSALHYIHGGPHAVQHFQLLMNSAIDDVEKTTCEEFNDAHACILYKGHSKDKTLASSYRTISSCPFIAKALDYYVRELSIDDWNDAQAETQFLGRNMSHELGALLLTETINHSIKENNKPVFCLFLDARSAFDLTIREIMVRHLYLVGTNGQQLIYIDNRLKHRRTFMEWDRKVLGPIHDELGFEQGGVSSGDFYTIYNSEQLTTAHEANLGVDVGPVQVSSIGQADDVVLLSDDVHLLAHLLTLTLDYCEKHHVTLAPEKTKLMVFSAPRHKDLVSYKQAISPININGTPIKFVSTAEHVGVTRSISGNLPHIQGRITAHIRKLFALLPAGLARNQNANPAVSLRIQAIHS